MVAYDSADESIRAYEIKRGNGQFDAGKIRSITRDLKCIQVLLKSYAELSSLKPTAAESKIIFYYGALQARNRRRCQGCSFRWPSMASGSRPSWSMPPPSPSAFRLPARRLPSGRRPRRARIRRPSPSSRICCDGGDSRWRKPPNRRPKSYAPRRRRPMKAIPTNCDGKEDRWCCAGFESTAGPITVEYRRWAPV
jgi:hypothetical protein